MQSSIHGSCIIKEEIDIPFDQADNDNSFNQQSFYEKAVADRTTEHDTNSEIKDAAFCPINIKTELSEDAIQLRCNNVLDMYIRRTVEKPSVKPQLINPNCMETGEPQPENEDLMETESEDEANVDVTADIDLESLVNNMRMKTGEIVMIEPPALVSNLELTEKGEEKSVKIAKVVMEKLTPARLVSKFMELTEKKEEERKKLTMRTTEERRVLRERKVENPDAENKATKEQELQEGKTKHKRSAGKTQKARSNESGKTHFLSLIKKECPANCELPEEQLQTSKKCDKCRKPLIFVCAKCDKKYDLRQSIKLHLDTKCHPRKVYSCQLCEYESSNLSHVRRHVLNKHKAALKKVSELIQSKDFQA